MKELVSVEPLADGVYGVRMDDARTHNALTQAMVRDISGAFAQAAAMQQCRVVILRGRSDVFCSGAARELLHGLAEESIAPTEILLPRVLLDFPLPVIAELEGSAVGGGFAFGLAADMVVMADESRYQFNFLDLGFSPGMGTTRLLEHVLSPALAHELLYSAEARRGTAFASVPGIHAVVPRAQVHARALDLALRIADKPRRALSALKRALSLPRLRAFEEARTLESLMHELTFPDARDRIDQNFGNLTQKETRP